MTSPPAADWGISMEKPTLNPALKGFWTAPARNRVLYGGRASSKSWDAAGFAVFLAANYRLRILCARQFQNKVEDSVYSLLKHQIGRFGLSAQFRILRNRILGVKTGSEFLFHGLWRGIDEIKSLEGVDLLWIEEAHNLTEGQWAVLEPTIRKDHSQVWIIFNPRLVSDFVYRRFVAAPPPETVVRRINYDENPFLSATMRRIIAAARSEDYGEYEHVYLGVPRDDDDDVLIRRAWIMAAIDAHKTLALPPDGRGRLGFDVADSGPDKCAAVFARGPLVAWAAQWQAGEDELLASCARVHQAARERQATIIYDCVGVGAAAGARFGELNGRGGAAVAFARFNAGAMVARPDAPYAGGVKNRDMFANLKAQAWWLLADRFRATHAAVRQGQPLQAGQLISLAADLPHLDQLIDELATPRRDFDPAGRVKVESKKDLSRRAVASPNLADALVMAFAPVAAPLAIDPEALASF